MALEKDVCNRYLLILKFQVQVQSSRVENQFLRRRYMTNRRCTSKVQYQILHLIYALDVRGWKHQANLDDVITTTCKGKTNKKGQICDQVHMVSIRQYVPLKLGQNPATCASTQMRCVFQRVPSCRRHCCHWWWQKAFKMGENL